MGENFFTLKIQEREEKKNENFVCSNLSKKSFRICCYSMKKISLYSEGNLEAFWKSLLYESYSMFQYKTQNKKFFNIARKTNDYTFNSVLINSFQFF